MLGNMCTQKLLARNEKNLPTRSSTRRYSLTISIKKVLLCKNYKYELKAGEHGDIK